MKYLKQILTTSILGSLLAGSALYSANIEAATAILSDGTVVRTVPVVTTVPVQKVRFIKKVTYVPVALASGVRVRAKAITIEQAQNRGPANFHVVGNAHLISLNNTLVRPLGNIPILGVTSGSGFKVVSGSRFGRGFGGQVGINGVLHNTVITPTGAEYLLPTTRGTLTRTFYGTGFPTRRAVIIDQGM